MFSKACEYGIKIMIYLAKVKEENRMVGVKEISKAIDSPEAFTAKILQQLAKQNLLLSLRGPHGGFQINKEECPIMLAKVVYAIDGEGLTSHCVLGFKTCSGEHPCPVHHKFVAIRDHLKGMLMTTTIEEVAQQVDEGTYFLA